MARPIYETEHDREEQRRVAGRLTARYGGTMDERPKLHPWDFDWARAGKVAALEVKCRKSRNGVAYNTIFMDAPKYDAIMAQPLDALYAVELDGVLMLSNLRAIDGELLRVTGGRTDRGDPADVGPVVLVPRSSFRVIA